ncbi:MAG: dihydropteroate synthase [Proteobacteria bacterium]|nr:dihydropteroate synthase [Pseudomonadota bacterium]
MTEPPLLHLGGRTLDVSVPRVMGVVNTTTDSFFDGGYYRATDEAIAHGFALLEEGADIVDVGGESTRPGAEPVEVPDELARVVPVVRALARAGALVSVDTMKPAVMRAVLDEGAAMINDVRALAAEGALDAVAPTRAAVCLMHMQGEPRTMQAAPRYDDVVAEVRHFLAQRVAACEAAGIARERIVVDPGFGFGKTLAHNLALLRHLDALQVLGVPVLAGLSRKAMLGTLTGQPVEERLVASVAAALVAVLHGAAIVRVHDVRATVDALKVWRAGTGHDDPAPLPGPGR